MSASCRTISFSFEAVRDEYLSRTQRATQRPAILSMLEMEIPCTWKFSRDEIFANFANDVMFANI